MAVRFSTGGQGAPAWANSRSEGKRSSGPSSSSPRRRWRWVGTKKAVVGASSRSTSRAVIARNRSKMASEPPRKRVPAAKRMETVWYIGEQTMWRSSAQKPH